MWNAYIVTHQNQVGNTEIVCYSIVSPEEIVHPKLLLEVNLENSLTLEGYKSIISNKKHRRGS